jgi:peptidoglycan/LPS O-acetylase OafA/YrhL
MEDQLYGLYALLLILMHRVGLRTTLMAVFGVTLIWRTVWPTLPEPSLGQDLTLGKFYLWPFMLWLHWTLGAIAADVYFGNVTLPKMMKSGSIMALLFGCGLLVNQKTFALLASTGFGQRLAIDHSSVPMQIISSIGEIGIGFALFMLLCRALRAEQADRYRGQFAQVFARLGRVSYSLYLTHVPILLILEHHLPIADTRFQWPLRIAAYLSICILLGTAYFFIVERWFLSGKCPIGRRRPAFEASGVAIP